MKATSIIVLLLTLLNISCDNKQSLQEFYVAKQDDPNYKAVDLPASMLVNEEANLSEKQKETLKTIKKVNIVAFPLKEGKKEALDKEREEVAQILADQEYNFLMKYGSPEQRAELYYLGEEVVDELVVVGFDEKQGFGVARVLGDDMNPSDIINLMKSLDGNSINQEGFNQVKNLFLASNKE